MIVDETNQSSDISEVFVEPLNSTKMLAHIVHICSHKNVHTGFRFVQMTLQDPDMSQTQQDTTGYDTGHSTVTGNSPNPQNAKMTKIFT